MEFDLQSLFGLHVHSCTRWPRSRNPPHLGSFTRSVLVCQDRRHLFVTPLARNPPAYDPDFIGWTLWGTCWRKRWKILYGTGKTLCLGSSFYTQKMPPQAWHRVRESHWMSGLSAVRFLRGWLVASHINSSLPWKANMAWNIIYFIS